MRDAVFRGVVEEAMRPLQMVEAASEGGVDHILDFAVRDFLPDGAGAPWSLRVSHRPTAVHPLFGDRMPCVDIALPLMTVDPREEAALDIVAAHAAPCLDHQRFCPGASVQWDPDTGRIGAFGRVRLWDQSPDALTVAVTERARSVVALAYLFAYRVWQLRTRHAARAAGAPARSTEADEARLHARMLALLDADPLRRR